MRAVPCHAKCAECNEGKAIFYDCLIVSCGAGNEIGAEGAMALAENLKVNHTISQLWLSGVCDSLI